MGHTGSGTIEKRNGILEEAKKPSDADLMRRLKGHIFGLYLKVKGVKTQSEEGFYDEMNKVDVVSQMAQIQKSLESYEE